MMKTYVTYLSLALVICLLSILFTGCNNAIQPIERIELDKAPPGQEIPTAVSLSIIEKDPMPATKWEFLSSEKLYVGIRMSKDLKENVTFTKFTYFNKDTFVETTVGFPKELGPYEPGQLQLLNLYDKWTLPTEHGSYEFRIYLGERIVSEALFNIID
jgi:hypothetical protein